MRAGVYFAAWFVAIAIGIASASGCGIDVVGGIPADASDPDGSSYVPPPSLDGSIPDGEAPDGQPPDDAGALLTVVVSAPPVTEGTVTASVGGVSCPSTCTAVFPLGTSVTLTAASSPDAVLLAWSGDGCIGREPTCTFTMDAPKTTTATFSPLRIYASSSGALYSYAGATGVATKVADFSGGGCGSTNMGDIAIARNGHMFAITLPSLNSATSELFRVDKSNAKCVTPAIGDLGKRCNGITFAPDPTQPGKDILYASCAGTVERVNLASGALTPVGSFGAGLEASGDIAYMPGFGMFVTLSGAGNDRLARVDRTTGAATIVGTDLGATNVWGLAFRGPSLIAFANNTTITVDPVSGQTTPTSGLGFQAYGAASGP